MKYNVLITVTVMCTGIYLGGYLFLVVFGNSTLLDYYGSNMVNTMIGFVLGIIVATFIKVQPYIKEIQGLMERIEELEKSE